MGTYNSKRAEPLCGFADVMAWVGARVFLILTVLFGGLSYFFESLWLLILTIVCAVLSVIFFSCVGLSSLGEDEDQEGS